MTYTTLTALVCDIVHYAPHTRTAQDTQSPCQSALLYCSCISVRQSICCCRGKQWRRSPRPLSASSAIVDWAAVCRLQRIPAISMHRSFRAEQTMSISHPTIGAAGIALHDVAAINNSTHLPLNTSCCHRRLSTASEVRKAELCNTRMWHCRLPSVLPHSANDDRMGTTWLLSTAMRPLTVEGSKVSTSMPYMPAPTTPKSDLTDSVSTARKMSAVTVSSSGENTLPTSQQTTHNGAVSARVYVCGAVRYVVERE